VFHSIRHTALSELSVDRGVSDSLLCMISGHKNKGNGTGSLTIYTSHDNLRKKQEIINLIEWNPIPYV
jgi:hypothetical protein